MQGQPDSEEQGRGGRVRPKSPDTFLIPHLSPQILSWDSACFVFMTLGVVSISFHSAFWTPPATESPGVIVKYVGYTLLQADSWPSPPDPLQQSLMLELTRPRRFWYTFSLRAAALSALWVKVLIYRRACFIRCQVSCIASEESISLIFFHDFRTVILLPSTKLSAYLF